MIVKNSIIIAALLLLPLAVSARDARISPDFIPQIRALEYKNGGRIGVAALDMADGQRLEYRAQERFALCSTFKLLLAADVLSRVDAGMEHLDRMVEYGPADMLKYAPIAQKHLKEGKMSVADLSAAALDYSDNTAANLLLKSVGGPKGLTDYARSLGDRESRLDRDEPALNANLPEDAQDTTTPSAMLQAMQKLLAGDALSQASRERLISWLGANTTGDARLRAGINPAWKIGDKTGTGENGATNDVAIVWPPGGKPFLVAVYYSGSTISQEKRDKVIAKVGRIVSTALVSIRH